MTLYSYKRKEMVLLTCQNQNLISNQHVNHSKKNILAFFFLPTIIQYIKVISLPIYRRTYLMNKNSTKAQLALI